MEYRQSRFAGPARLSALALTSYPMNLSMAQSPAIQGRETLMFGSNNYLGLTRHPEVMEAAREALEKYGTSCTGSRLLNGTIPPHVQFEEEIADFLGYPAAILFTTGFMANQGALPVCAAAATRCFRTATTTQA